MKEHAKKALKHDFSVAGKTVPTLAIVALFLVGGGSAAILSSFGTISGEATVDQAIEIDSSGQASLDYFGGDGVDVVAGETKVSGPYTVTNNMDSAFEPAVTTDLSRETGDDSFTVVQTVDNTGSDNFDVDWTYSQNVDSFDGVSSDDQVGIQTTYVNAFHNAGESGYEAPDFSSENVLEVSEASDLDDVVTVNSGIAELDTGGSYDAVEFTSDINLADLSGSPEALSIEESGLTIYGEAGDETLTSSTSGSTNGIYIEAENVKVTGLTFDYSTDESNAWNNAIATYYGDAVISHVSVEGDAETDVGIMVTEQAIDGDSDSEGASIENVYVTDAEIGVLVSDYDSTRHGIQQTDGSVSVESSDFTADLGYGVVVSAHDGQGGKHPMGTTVSSNKFDVSKEAVFVPDDETFKGTGVSAVDSGEVDATGNFFYEVPDVSNVDTSYEELSNFEVGAESTEAFGVVNEFSPYLTTDSFELETTIGDSSS